jgi:hypothetical protein
MVKLFFRVNPLAFAWNQIRLRLKDKKSSFYSLEGYILHG